MKKQANKQAVNLISEYEAETKILLIRHKRVLIDRDLAELYGVSTKVLNQAVKRNALRFPGDFCFQLTAQEKQELVTNCDRFKSLKHSTSSPYVFTEQGVAMLSGLLNSQRAILVNVAIMRAFVKLRNILASNKELTHKFAALEGKVGRHDGEIKAIFETIRRLMTTSRGPR
jgi:hypothetical protein